MCTRYPPASKTTAYRTQTLQGGRKGGKEKEREGKKTFKVDIEEGIQVHRSSTGAVH